MSQNNNDNTYIGHWTSYDTVPAFIRLKSNPAVPFKVRSDGSVIANSLEVNGNLNVTGNITASNLTNINTILDNKADIDHTHDNYVDGSATNVTLNNLNVTTLNGYNIGLPTNSGNSLLTTLPCLATIKTDGMLECGRYIDFHYTGSKADNDFRMECTGSGNLKLNGNITTTGNIYLPNGKMVEITCGSSDYARILGGGSSDAGYLEIATSDNGNEPIYVRQYLNGGSSNHYKTVTHQITLLDADGNTTFTGNIIVNNSIGGTVLKLLSNNVAVDSQVAMILGKDFTATNNCASIIYHNTETPYFGLGFYDNNDILSIYPDRSISLNNVMKINADTSIDIIDKVHMVYDDNEDYFKLWVTNTETNDITPVIIKPDGIITSTNLTYDNNTRLINLETTTAAQTESIELNTNRIDNLENALISNVELTTTNTTVPATELNGKKLVISSIPLTNITGGNETFNSMGSYSGYSVHAINNKLILLSIYYQELLLVSEDGGETWVRHNIKNVTQSTQGNTELYSACISMAYGNNKYVVIPIHDSNCYVSSDLVSWSAYGYRSSDNTSNKAFYVNYNTHYNQFLIKTSYDNKYYTSTDCINWVEKEIPIVEGEYSGYCDFNFIYENEYIAFTTGNKLHYSDDNGVTWHHEPLPGAYTVGQNSSNTMLCYCNNMYILVEETLENSPYQIAYSHDLQNWNVLTMNIMDSAEYLTYNPIIYSPGLDLYYYSGLYSNDLITWYRLYPVSMIYDVYKTATEFNGKFYMSNMMYSNLDVISYGDDVDFQMVRLHTPKENENNITIINDKIKVYNHDSSTRVSSKQVYNISDLPNSITPENKSVTYAFGYFFVLAKGQNVCYYAEANTENNYSDLTWNTIPLENNLLYNLIVDNENKYLIATGDYNGYAYLNKNTLEFTFISFNEASVKPIGQPKLEIVNDVTSLFLPVKAENNTVYLIDNWPENKTEVIKLRPHPSDNSVMCKDITYDKLRQRLIVLLGNNYITYASITDSINFSNLTWTLGSEIQLMESTIEMMGGNPFTNPAYNSIFAIGECVIVVGSALFVTGNYTDWIYYYMPSYNNIPINSIAYMNNKCYIPCAEAYMSEESNDTCKILTVENMRAYMFGIYYTTYMQAYASSSTTTVPYNYKNFNACEDGIIIFDEDNTTQSFSYIRIKDGYARANYVKIDKSDIIVDGNVVANAISSEDKNVKIEVKNDGVDIENGTIVAKNNMVDFENKLKAFVNQNEGHNSFRSGTLYERYPPLDGEVTAYTTIQNDHVMVIARRQFTHRTENNGIKSYVKLFDYKTDTLYNSDSFETATLTNIYARAYGNNTFILFPYTTDAAYKNICYISTDPDAKKWQKIVFIHSDTTYMIEACTFDSGSNQFVALTNTGYALSSYNGINWAICSTTVPITDEGSGYYTMSAYNGTIIATELKHNVIVSKDSGKTWSKTTVSEIDDYIGDVLYVNHLKKFILVLFNSFQYYTADYDINGWVEHKYSSNVLRDYSGNVEYMAANVCYEKSRGLVLISGKYRQVIGTLDLEQWYEYSYFTSSNQGVTIATSPYNCYTFEATGLYGDGTDEGRGSGINIYKWPLFNYEKSKVIVGNDVYTTNDFKLNVHSDISIEGDIYTKSYITKCDDLNWTPRLSTTMNGYIYSICYGNNAYVCVYKDSYNNNYYYSTDNGITWNKIRINDNTGAAKDIVFGDKFVGVFSRDTSDFASNIIYSTDGITWNYSNYATPILFEKIIWDGQTYMIFGVNGKILYSDNGIDWTEYTFDTTEYGENVIFTYAAGNENITIGINPSYDYYIYSQDHGRTWKKLLLNDGPSQRQVLKNICYGNGKFIGCVYSDNDMIGYSEDGFNWHYYQFSTKNVNFYHIKYCIQTNEYVMLSNTDSNYIAISKDGIAWSLYTCPNAVSNIELAHDRIIIVRNGVSDYLISTAERYANIKNNDNEVTTYTPKIDNLVECVGNNDYVNTWDMSLPKQHKNSNTSNIASGVGGNGLVVCAGSGRTLYTYTDKNTCKVNTAGANRAFTKVVYGDGSFVGFSSGLLWSQCMSISWDGKTWIDLDSTTYLTGCTSTDYFYDIIYRNNYYVIVGKHSNKCFVWNMVLDPYEQSVTFLTDGNSVSEGNNPYYNDDGYLEKVFCVEHDYKCYAVSNNGKVFSSDSRQSWRTLFNNTTGGVKYNYYADGVFMGIRHYEEDIDQGGTRDHYVPVISNSLYVPSQDYTNVELPNYYDADKSNLIIITAYEPLHYGKEVFVFITNGMFVSFMDETKVVKTFPEYDGRLPFKPVTACYDGHDLVFIDKIGTMAWPTRVKIPKIKATTCNIPLKTVRSMAYGDGKYIAVGEANEGNCGGIIISEDGYNWRAVKGLNNYPIFAKIRYDSYHDEFIITAYSNRVGTTSVIFRFRDKNYANIYPTTTIPTYQIVDIQYNANDKTFPMWDAVSIRSYNMETNTVTASGDLPTAAKSKEYKSSGLVNDCLVAVNDSGTHVFYYTGSGWSSSDLVSFSSSSTYNKAWLLIKSNIAIIIYSYSGKAYYGHFDTYSNAVTFDTTYLYTPFSEKIINAVFVSNPFKNNPDKDIFIAVTNNYNKMYYSINGFQWYEYGVSIYSNPPTVGVYGNGKFVLMSSDGVKLINVLFDTYDNDNVDPAETKIMQKVYPIGSIYTSMNNIDPFILFGFGTWRRIENRFLYCATSDSRITGGSKNHTHELGDDGWAQISMHRVGAIRYREKNLTDSQAYTTDFKVSGTDGSTTGTSEEFTDKWGAYLDGNTETSSNMPPYITVYAWERIK